MNDDEIRQAIIGLAFKVHKYPGAGFVEKVYENALKLELERAEFIVKQQVPIDVLYDSVVIGEFFADLIVQNKVIVELKAVQSLLPEHEVQLVNYLTATGIESGLLLNFGKSVQMKRKFREYRKLEK